jgi:hypothetical protein
MMTEEEWHTATDRAAMFAFLQDRVSDRKLRLYMCGGCRAIWELLIRPESRTAVEVAERFADQEATAHEVGRASYRAEADTLRDPPEGFCEPAAWLAHYALKERLFWRCPEGREEGWYLDPHGFSRWTSSQISNMSEIAWPGQWLSEDIFGNPFRPVVFAPEWRSDTAVSLAKHIYEARDFAQMPILADALQDAGCDNADVLNHCRHANQVHVRGCWVVDGVLGKS